MVGRVLYGYTPTHKTVALDAASGKLLWTFDSGLAGVGANRGLMYWKHGAEARVFAAVDNFVYALDAATGKPVAAFGQGGRIDLRENLGRDPASQSVRLTTPGVIWRDLMIVGGRVGENLPASPGHVRAYDVRSGALRWTFHTIPAARRTRLRHLADGRLAVHRRRQQLVGHDAGREARPGVRAHRFGRGRFLRREPARRQPVRQLPAGARRGHRQAALAFPVRAARRARSRPAQRADADHAAP